MIKEKTDLLTLMEKRLSFTQQCIEKTEGMLTDLRQQEYNLEKEIGKLKRL